MSHTHRKRAEPPTEEGWYYGRVRGDLAAASREIMPLNVRILPSNFKFYSDEPRPLMVLGYPFALTRAAFEWFGPVPECLEEVEDEPEAQG